ncbi:hypothetical protein GCM10009646_13920 [Streptomyces aureus]
MAARYRRQGALPPDLRAGPRLPVRPPALSQVLRPHAPEVTDMARSKDEPQNNPVPPYGPPVHDAIATNKSG